MKLRNRKQRYYVYYSGNYTNKKHRKKRFKYKVDLMKHIWNHFDDSLGGLVNVCTKLDNQISVEKTYGIWYNERKEKNEPLKIKLNKV